VFSQNLEVQGVSAVHAKIGFVPGLSARCGQWRNSTAVLIRVVTSADARAPGRLTTTNVFIPTLIAVLNAIFFKRPFN
jgi:hypothetical protein